MDRGSSSGLGPGHGNGPAPRRNRAFNPTQNSRHNNKTSNNTATRGRRRLSIARNVVTNSTSMSPSADVSSASTVPSTTYVNTPPHSLNQSTIRSRLPRPKNRPRRRPPPPPRTVAIKLIVRHLPPTLSAERFSEIANPYGASTAIWRSFDHGSVENTGSVKRTAHVVRHSVAYLAFSSMDDGLTFYNNFQGFVFSDADSQSQSSPSTHPSTHVAKPSGQPTNHYTVCIERAINQTAPIIKRRSQHVLHGTIEKDLDYQAFLEALENGGDLASIGRPVSATPPLVLPAAKKDSHGPNDDRKSKGKAEVVTPLMEDVRARRKERDLKKKPAKSTLRPTRIKSRVGPAFDSTKGEVESSKAAIRRKKRRGVEVVKVEQSSNALADRRQKPTKAGPSSSTFDRGGNLTRRRDHVGGKTTAGSPAVKHTAGTKLGTNVIKENAFEGPESSPKSDVRSVGRPPYGSSGRGRGKYHGATNGITIHNGGYDREARVPDHGHGSVRLLKKEASNVSKT